MKFLASLIVTCIFTIYIYLVTLIANVVPWFMTPFIYILAIALVIYFTTKDSLK